MSILLDKYSTHNKGITPMRNTEKDLPKTRPSKPDYGARITRGSGLTIIIQSIQSPYQKILEV